MKAFVVATLACASGRLRPDRDDHVTPQSSEDRQPHARRKKFLRACHTCGGLARHVIETQPKEMKP
ncbi:hypothetical protein [Burkholderia ubonensis]|uniref:hypothetical protein n=1 Tax=Burkholderia ubonensis TaxID=101571 RepID=UPI0012F77336|nr:hypothetical protein [Burkholderia ubonensis]